MSKPEIPEIFLNIVYKRNVLPQYLAVISPSAEGGRRERWWLKNWKKEYNFNVGGILFLSSLKRESKRGRRACFARIIIPPSYRRLAVFIFFIFLFFIFILAFFTLISTFASRSAKCESEATVAEIRERRNGILREAYRKPPSLAGIDLAYQQLSHQVWANRGSLRSRFFYTACIAKSSRWRLKSFIIPPSNSKAVGRDAAQRKWNTIQRIRSNPRASRAVSYFFLIPLRCQKQ